MRVTGGTLGGRKLSRPPPGVRPTADRVREALFSQLAGWLEDVAVLDLYAGTGAMGIEALSRGAREAVFVEEAARSIAVLRANLGRLELGPRTRVIQGDVARSVARLGREGRRFGLVLADPPYAADTIGEVLAGLADAGILDSDARVVVERGRRHPLPPIPGLSTVDERRYGDTVLVHLEPARPGAGHDRAGRKQVGDDAPG